MTLDHASTSIEQVDLAKEIYKKYEGASCTHGQAQKPFVALLLFVTSSHPACFACTGDHSTAWWCSEALRKAEHVHTYHALATSGIHI